MSTRCASYELRFRALREMGTPERQATLSRKPCRASQHTQAYRGTLYGVNRHQVRRGRRVAGAPTSLRGVLNPCAREPQAHTGRFLWGNMTSDHEGKADYHDMLSSCGRQQRGANEQDSGGNINGHFGFWTDEC